MPRHFSKFKFPCLLPFLNLKAALVAVIMFLGICTNPAHAVDLLYATMDNGSIVTYDISGATATDVQNSKQVFVPAGSGFRNGLAFDSSGNLYAGNMNTNVISKITPGGSITPFVTGVNSPYGMKFDSSGNLFVAMYGTNTVDKISPSGSVSQFASLSSPLDIAIDPTDTLYVSSGSTTSVAKITPSGTLSTFVSYGNTGINLPTGITLDSTGNVFVSNRPSGSGQVLKFTPSGTGSVFATVGQTNPIGVIIDKQGYLYVTNPSTRTISKYNSNGGLEFSWSTGTAPADFAVYFAFQPAIVPEPSTYALGLIASSVLVVVARRRVRRA